MRTDVQDFSAKVKGLASAREAVSFAYLFEIFLHSGQILRLTSSSVQVLNNGQVFHPFSTLSLLEGEFNDSAENVIVLTGVYDDSAINQNLNLAGCRIKIHYFVSDEATCLVEYFISKIEKRDMDFTLLCQSEAEKYNQSLLLLYSKTCRANFGDEKCRVDPAQYTTTYQVSAVSGRMVHVVNLDRPDGYYNFGKAVLRADDFVLSSKVINQFRNFVELETVIDQDLIGQLTISLTCSCDKNFITCCNKFNNAVNFRGEPTIGDKPACLIKNL